MFRNFTFNRIFSYQKIIIIVNYHRIGIVEKKNPFHKLHTVSLSTFKFHIFIFKLIGNFVSLNDISEGKLNSKINFSLTFDDVSKTVENVYEILLKNKISFAICPCMEITQKGYSWRDKIYFLDNLTDTKKLKKKILNYFNLDKSLLEHSFYSLTKNKKINSLKLQKLINPEFKKVQDIFDIYKLTRHYLNVSDIKKIIKKSNNLTIVNHTKTHPNLESISIKQLKMK